MNKQKIIALFIILVLLILGLVAYQTKGNYDKQIKELQKQTISGHLEQIKNEARALEKEKADYEQKKIDEKLQELYDKSWKLQNINNTGETGKLSK